MGNLEDFAKHELTLAGVDKPNSDYNGMLADAVLELIRVFQSQGHSGFSASLVVQMFQKVAMLEPLTPLTGEAGEWKEIGNGQFQNRRCSHVFHGNGRAYNVQGKIFRESNGVCFTNIDSCVDIVFPYTPHSEYVDV